MISVGTAEANGNIFVHGRMAENDKDVVNGFKEFLAGTNFI